LKVKKADSIMHIITITTSFPETEKSPAGLFILRTLQKMTAVSDIVVPANDSETYEDLVPNGITHWVRYAPRKWSLITSTNKHGGIPTNLKLYPYLIFLYPLMMISLFLKTWKLTRKNTILHAHWLPNGIIGTIIKKIKGNPFVLTIRGSDQILLKIAIFKPIVNWIFNSADVITTVSQSLMDEIDQRFRTGQKTHFIPNGVDLPALFSKKYNEIFRLLFVGSLIPGKGVHDLIYATKQIKDCSNLQLDIIGSGFEYNRLLKLVEQNQLSSRVHFFGAISPRRVLSKMLESDCLILPSYSEGMPNVVKEAMACGLPVVATNVGGTPELITHGEQGFLFQPGDVKALKHYIEYLSEHRKEALEMGSKGRQYIIDRRLTWKSTADNYLKLYKKIIRKF